MGESEKTRGGEVSLLAGLLILLGLYLTLEGYRSFEGDQAYRLPLLLHRLQPDLYASDPFVRAFDNFNPHSGALGLLGAATRVIGLSATLFVAFCATFLVTGWGIVRLTRLVWPENGLPAGLTAFGLVLLAKAGNIGTNHLFEPLLLDRMVALALGWLAIGSLVQQDKLAPLLVGGCVMAANPVHPSLGLQLGLLLGSAWAVMGVLASWTGVTRLRAMAGVLVVGLALLPALLALPGTSQVLFSGLDPDQFLLLAAQVQSPQHMLPHLWRFPQWLAWFAYLGLGAWGFLSVPQPAKEVVPYSPALPRRRLLIMLGLLLVGLLVAGLAIEAGNIRATLFQPFRVATVVRGLCLVMAAGPVVWLAQRGTFEGRLRACLLATSLSADWPFVWVVGLEIVLSWVERWRGRIGAVPVIVCAALAGYWLWRHDPEQGQMAIGLAILGASLAELASRWAVGMVLSQGRILRLTALAWALPLVAIVWQTGLIPPRVPPPVALISHIRVAELPVGDLERIAVWCREHTSPEATFIGPPGPKGFRLWSRRSLMFNRAGSPYHAAGLADWASRFQAHVGYQGSLAEFAASYLANRQALERGFDLWDAGELVRLARSQGANHLLASSSALLDDPQLTLLHTEGRYAVYRVNSQETSAELDSR